MTLPSNSRLDTERLQQSLRSALAAMCPASFRDHRDDMVQEAMLKVAKATEKAPADRALNATYLWRTAYCALVDELRRRRRRQEVSLEEADPYDGMAHPSPGPHAAVLGQEIRRALAACLGGLVEARRLTVILHLQGEKPRDAAEILGWSRKRVYNLLARGLQDLRQCLEVKGVKP